MEEMPTCAVDVLARVAPRSTQYVTGHHQRWFREPVRIQPPGIDHVFVSLHDGRSPRGRRKRVHRRNGETETHGASWPRKNTSLRTLWHYWWAFSLTWLSSRSVRLPASVPPV